jgi:hypothetical protein
LERPKTPAAYHTAFTKLAKLNTSDTGPQAREVFLLRSHPPIAEVLATAV